jgi:hypothetical protein
MRPSIVYRVAGVGLLLIGASTTAFLLWRQDAHVVDENHIVENTQVACLLLAAAVHFLRAGALPRLSDRDARLIRQGLGLFCISLTVRELDIDRMGDRAIASNVELAVRGAVVVCWVLFSWRLLPSIESLWSRKASVACSSLALLTFAGCAFYLASWPFDKFPDYFGRPEAKFIEQTSQLNATLLLLVAAVMGSLPGCRERLAGCG